MENIIKYFDYLKINDIEKYDREIIKKGLDIKVGNLTGWDIIAKLINFSRKKLSTMDRFYLEPLINIVKSQKTTADAIIEYNISSVDELVDYLS